MPANKLTEVQVRNAKIQPKFYDLRDGGSLYLRVQPNGTKSWRFDYRCFGKRKTLSMGLYPELSLKGARGRVQDARVLLADNVDPSDLKQQQKRDAQFAAGNDFAALAKEWWEQQKGSWTEDHAGRIWARLENDVLPKLGPSAISTIKPQNVISVVRAIENRGANDVASRVLQDIRRICRYAVQTGRAEFNPATELSGVLKAVKTSHRPSLPREELPEFLLALENYHKQGRLLTQLAIQLLILTFVRSGELRGAGWHEFDLDGALWRIPGERMKMGTDHLVPLPKQALEILKQIKLITGQYPLVFPSERRRTQGMSDNTMRRAIFKLGYDGKTAGKSKAVPHGFRATASSILNESGFNPDAIERQLSHQERNGVRAAYTHHARYLEERTEMMQWWADFLDAQRQSSEAKNG